VIRLLEGVLAGCPHFPHISRDHRTEPPDRRSRPPTVLETLVVSTNLQRRGGDAARRSDVRRRM